MPTKRRPSPLLDGLLEARARREARDLARGDLHRLARARVAALAGAPLGDVELAESGERDLVTRAQGNLDRLQDRVHGRTGVLLRQAAVVGDPLDEIRLRHSSSFVPRRGRGGAKLTT